MPASELQPMVFPEAPCRVNGGGCGRDLSDSIPITQVQKPSSDVPTLWSKG